ncbi:hypothetical protein CNEO_1500031 [Clostridium neonatale]|nr:hypothetical protein CNEO_1500031 [Clostridium neonatale]
MTKSYLSNKPTFIINTYLPVHNKAIISYYEKHFYIEVSYTYHKTTFNFYEFKILSSKSIHKYYHMIFLTYTFLEPSGLNIVNYMNSKILNM